MFIITLYHKQIDKDELPRQVEGLIVMFAEYLLTGATGFLGNTIAWILQERGCQCKALVTPGDSFISRLPTDTELFYGDILDRESLEGFFNGVSEDSCLIHCAGIVSIASKPNPMIYKVNVEVTRNALSLAARHQIGRMIHVSSIHAIPEKPIGEIISETDVFDENLVKGEYAKSKAVASGLALQAAREGLNLSVVHPSGIIGPGDWRHGQITSAIMSYCQGELSVGVYGGNNFVDVRDVAYGILSCLEKGKAGECYILSGHNTTIKAILEHVRSVINGKKIIYLPLGFGKIIAPLYEKISLMRHETPFLTPYSAYALGVNSDYSHKKASMALGYNPREIEETIEDTIRWLRATAQI